MNIIVYLWKSFVVFVNNVSTPLLLTLNNLLLCRPKKLSELCTWATVQCVFLTCGDAHFHLHDSSWNSYRIFTHPDIPPIHLLCFFMLCYKICYNPYFILNRNSNRFWNISWNMNINMDLKQILKHNLKQILKRKSKHELKQILKRILK